MDAVALPSVMDTVACGLRGRALGVGGLSAPVPLVGESVGAEGLRPDGLDYLFMHHRLNGELVITAESILADNHETHGAGASAGGGSSVDAECNVDHYDPDIYSVSPIGYYTNVGASRPSSMTSSEAQVTFKKGFDYVLTARNNCNFADNVGATAILNGNTTRHADIHLNGCTSSHDSVSVLSFGNLDGFYAFSCWHLNAFLQFVEGDIKINSYDYNMVSENDWNEATCGHSVHMPSIMTHEVMHLYGLEHVTAPEDDRLSMYPHTPRCSDAWSTLGRGDILGLESKY